MIAAASHSPVEDRQLTIVHVTADYPDAITSDKTPAIKQLVELVDDKFGQHVISLNRISPSVATLADIVMSARSPILSWSRQDELTSVRYAAPAFGMLHASMLQRLADALSTKLLQLPRPDLLVAYKLTIEGLVVASVARQLGVPYAVVIQGNTDTKIVRSRPDLAARFADVLNKASVVFAMAPWALTEIQSRLRITIRDPVLLPCPITLDNPLAPVLNGDGFVTAFHLRNHRLKNFSRLCKAVARAQRTVPGIGLTVYGGGSTQDNAEVARISAHYGPVSLAGPIANEELPAPFNRAVGFVMPSLRETFGMVFIEALFAGCPVIYPAGRAIDGYFDRQPFAVPVDPRNTGSIAEAIARCVRDETRNKTALAEWQQSDHPARFQRATLRAGFAAALTRAAAAPGSAGHGTTPVGANVP